MRWSAVGLLALGVLAALAASYLVTSVRGPREAAAAATGPGEPGERVVVAARDLEAPILIESNAVELRELPEDELPAGTFSRESEVIGRVLISSVAAGEALAGHQLAEPGSGVHLASVLRPGMRAVGLTLAESMETLIEPGNVVDVLATVEIGGQPVSMTLLQSVVVVAVGDKTLVSGESDRSVRREGRARGVVLLVDSKQAEVLTLVLEEGSVALALRNPADDELVSGSGTRLGELSSAPRRPTPGPVARRPEPRQREVIVMKGGQSVVKTVPSVGPRDGK